MKLPLIPLLFILINANAQDSGMELLDASIRNPGSYSQMCDVQTLPTSVGIPLYALSLDSEMVLSVDVLNQLRSNRKTIVPALKEKFQDMDMTQSAYSEGSELTEDDKIKHSGIDEDHLNQLVLNITMDLNAVEILPELLRIESELSTMLELNAKDPALVLPNTYIDVGFSTQELLNSDSDEKKSFVEKFKTSAKLQHKKSRLHCIVAQRDVLATMLCLLRNQGYAPLLESDIEKTFVTALKEKSKDENLAQIKNEKDIQKNDRGWIAIDKISKLPYLPAHPVASQPYTPETRAKILKWVNDWLTKNPAEKRNGSNGMSAYPVER